MSSELAKSIAAIFLPADWRRWTYSHYQKFQMVEELLRNNTTDAINRADAVRVIQDARERGGYDLRELISELKALPVTVNQAERRAVIAYLERFDGSELLPMLIADIKAGRHHTTTKGDR